MSSRLPALAVLFAMGYGGYYLWQKMQPEPDAPYVPEIFTGAASNPVSDSGWKSHHVAMPSLTPSTWTPPAVIPPAHTIQPLPPAESGFSLFKKAAGLYKAGAPNSEVRVPNFWNDRASVI